MFTCTRNHLRFFLPEVKYIFLGMTILQTYVPLMDPSRDIKNLLEIPLI